MKTNFHNKTLQSVSFIMRFKGTRKWPNSIKPGHPDLIVNTNQRFRFFGFLHVRGSKPLVKLENEFPLFSKGQKK